MPCCPRCALPWDRVAKALTDACFRYHFRYLLRFCRYRYLFGLSVRTMSKWPEACKRKLSLRFPFPHQDQITVVTTHSAVTTHTTMIRVNDTLGAIFSRLNIEDGTAALHSRPDIKLSRFRHRVRVFMYRQR